MIFYTEPIFVVKVTRKTLYPNIRLVLPELLVLLELLKVYSFSNETAHITNSFCIF